MYPFSTPLPCFMLTLPHSGGCYRILSTSEHQVSQSVYLRAPSQSVYLYISQYQVSQSVCLSVGVCGGGSVCLCLSHKTHTHIHTQLCFQFYLNQPLLASRRFIYSSTNLLAQLPNTAWFGESSSTITSPGTTQAARHLWHSLPYTGCFLSCQIFLPFGSFMMTIPSSYQSPPFFSPVFFRP